MGGDIRLLLSKNPLTLLTAPYVLSPSSSNHGTKGLEFVLFELSSLLLQ